MSSGAVVHKEEPKPKEAYEYLQKCYVEGRQQGEGYLICAVEVTDRVRSVLAKEQPLSILNLGMEGDKNASKVPWYMGTEGGTSESCDSTA